jgi:hypothetical protein
MNESVLSYIKRQQIYALRRAFQASGLSTLPADRTTTERIITGFYARLGKPAPQFHWLEGPLSCILAHNVIEQRGVDSRRMRGVAVDREIKDKLRDQLRCRLAETTRRQLGDEVCTELGTKHWIQLEDHKRDHEGNEPEIDVDMLYASEGLTVTPIERRCPFDSDVGPEVDWAIHKELHGVVGGVRYEPRGALYGPLWEDACRDVGVPLSPVERLSRPYRIWGGENQCWVSHHMACIGAGAKPEASDVVLLAEWDALNRACGWWFAFEHMVFCAERHAQIRFDAGDRLHGEHGPAIECRDGLKLYRWHGIEVPPEWIERREALDLSIALTWRNIEQRRVAAEIFGWSRLLERLRCRVIDADRDPRIGTLLECELPDAGPARFLRVRCGTGREFVLSVPRAVQTARAANAWTYGLKENEYQLEVRS